MESEIAAVSAENGLGEGVLSPEEAVGWMFDALAVVGIYPRADARARLTAAFRHPNQVGPLIGTALGEAHRILAMAKAHAMVEAELISPDRLATASTRELTGVARYLAEQRTMQRQQFAELMNVVREAAPVEVDTTSREARAKQAVLSDLLQAVDLRLGRLAREGGHLGPPSPEPRDEGMREDEKCETKPIQRLDEQDESQPEVDFEAAPCPTDNVRVSSPCSVATDGEQSVSVPRPSPSLAYRPDG